MYFVLKFGEEVWTFCGTYKTNDEAEKEAFRLINDRFAVTAVVLKPIKVIDTDKSRTYGDDDFPRVLHEFDILKYYTKNIPKIVCLCGSTRYWKQFQQSSLEETLDGNIVLSIGAARSADDSDKSFGGYTPASQYDSAKAKLDELHKRKIDLADEVLVLNVDNYIGESTRSEVEYAAANRKLIRWLLNCKCSAIGLDNSGNCIVCNLPIDGHLPTNFKFKK